MGRAKPYHHGDLRRALLDAAILLIAEVGPKAFTLREVARRAGVSHNAPYRHFRDKDDLISAVAEQGFRELRAAMLKASAEEKDAVARLKNSGLAYIAFAMRRPEHFAVMFDAPVRKDSKHEAAEQSFAVLVGLVKDCVDEGAFPPGEPMEFALLAWTMVHGVAKLAISRRLPYESKSSVLKFARFVIDKSLPLAGTRMRHRK